MPLRGSEDGVTLPYDGKPHCTRMELRRHTGTRHRSRATHHGLLLKTIFVQAHRQRRRLLTPPSLQNGLYVVDNFVILLVLWALGLFLYRWGLHPLRLLIAIAVLLIASSGPQPSKQSAFLCTVIR